MSALQGKVAVITGGSSGIGLAIAKRFVWEGACVFITSRRQPELDKAVEAIGKNVTGVQGDVSKKATPGRSTYSGTKAALRAFVRTWTIELKARQIRSNVLSPGATDTPIIDRLFDSKEAAKAGREQLATATPLGRMGRPEEIAAAALFLASSESSFVAGIDLRVDGGLSAV